MTTSKSAFHRFGALAVLMMLPALILSGCDKVPTFQELTGNEAKPEPAPAPVVEPPPPPQAAEPVAKPPAPKTPEEIYEEFLAKEQAQRKDEDIAKLAEFDPSLRSQIQELDMSRSQMSDKGAAMLTAFPKVEDLNIDYTGVTSVGLAEVGKLTGLKHLSLAKTRINETALEGIDGLTDLEYLDISQTSSDDLSFQHLVGMKNLQVLRITDMPHLRGQGLAELANRGVLSNLRELYAPNTKIGNYGLEALEKLPHLQILNLNNAAVNDIHMPLIGSRRELVTLYLERNTISSQGVKSLAKLKNLETLSLANCKSVQDEAFNFIKNLKTLTLLNVSGTGVTPDAVKMLQEKFLPDTEIKYDKPN
ncbi:MAG: hypothetical protein KDA93_01310 [Planctomycetaceae bacterium]|nr:hypothetical protein [Planctomycetaceae bacterium]